MNEIQRGRLIAAAVDTVHELGYPRMTVAQVLNRARVSRKTFYEIFVDREDCFLAAFDDAISQASALAGEAYAGQRDWRRGTRAALGSLLAAMEEEPALARLCMLEALAAGASVRERRTALLAQLAEFVDRGGDVRGASKRPPPLTGVGVVGGVVAVLQARLSQGGDQSLSELLGPLMSMIVLPYLGPRAARSELAKPPLRVAGRGDIGPTLASADPLDGMSMRLTYRTIRVLGVIAEQPGASNREIAEGAGIVDQGQISKLLSRLLQFGLVENFGHGQRRGMANAWELTARGEQLESASRQRWR
ncbi:MAG TPA: TetR family transcriptional regulator [Solirubrobacteraceae bacterium]|nr:TetR family transcriptional regulator [Solirubrobacteraceae bacterium]